MAPTTLEELMNEARKRVAGLEATREGINRSIKLEEYHLERLENKLAENQAQVARYTTVPS